MPVDHCESGLVFGVAKLQKRRTTGSFCVNHITTLCISLDGIPDRRRSKVKGVGNAEIRSSSEFVENDDRPALLGRKMRGHDKIMPSWKGMMRGYIRS